LGKLGQHDAPGIAVNAGMDCTCSETLNHESLSGLLGRLLAFCENNRSVSSANGGFQFFKQF
jgi:hypothetical protein